MANIDIRPLFKFPATVGALISFLESSIKALKTGQVEPIRHFLEVRLQDRNDRNNLVSIMSKWIVLLRMGQGETETGKHDMFGVMPVGYIPSKFKGKVVLRQVIEPSKAFTDRKKTDLRTKDVPVKVHKEYVGKEISLEHFSIPPSKGKDFGLKLGMARVLIRAGLEELALSDDWTSDLSTGLVIQDLDGNKKEKVTFFDLLQEMEELTDPQVSEDQDGTLHFALESANGALPLFLGLLLKTLPKLIKRLEEGSYAEKYPKLLKALKAVQQVVEIIQSEK